MTPDQFIGAARVPESLESQSFGLWTIHRQTPSLPIDRVWIGFETMTVLSRFTNADIHLLHGETVMEDSRRELSRHLPIWMRAKGQVLLSGLGLGCVVRGLLASPQVDRITVIEIDGDILRIVGREFENNPRVRLIHGDALKVKIGGHFDFAWHDIHSFDSTHLAVLHARLLLRFAQQARVQGAWQFPRYFRRMFPGFIDR